MSMEIPKPLTLQAQLVETPDPQPHPRILAAFYHRHHQHERLSSDVGFRRLRRQAEFEILEEGCGDNLHLNDSKNRITIVRWHSWAKGKGHTQIASRDSREHPRLPKFEEHVNTY